jgi:hypothetical protein
LFNISLAARSLALVDMSSTSSPQAVRLPQQRQLSLSLCRQTRRFFIHPLHGQPRLEPLRFSTLLWLAVVVAVVRNLPAEVAAVLAASLRLLVFL